MDARQNGAFGFDEAYRVLAEHADLYAEQLSALPGVMDACIARYKRKLIAAGIAKPPEGVAVITPVRRPKTLADAKILADSLLENS